MIWCHLWVFLWHSSIVSIDESLVFELNILYYNSAVLFREFTRFWCLINKVRMIITSYQSEIIRHISLFSYIPGLTLYEFKSKQNIWIVSKSTKKKNHYKLSHLFALISTSLMVIRLLTKSYDIFLTNLGGALTAGVQCLPINKVDLELQPKQR